MLLVTGACIYKKIILKNVHVVRTIPGMHDLLKFPTGKTWQDPSDHKYSFPLEKRHLFRLKQYL